MKQLIFDCDGVLVDTEIIAAEVMVRLLNSYGLNIDIEYYIDNFTGKTFTGILNMVDVEIKDDLNALSSQSEKEIYSNLRAIEGMSELVKSQILPVAIVSNSATWQVRKALAFLEIEGTIKDNYFSSQMVERPKPFPDVYLLAAEKNDVNPKDCLVVEDSLSGAKAALDAGMNVIGFAGASHIRSGHDKKLLDLGVTKVAYHPAELTNSLRELTST